MFITRHSLKLIGYRTCYQLKYSGIATNYEGLILTPKFSNEEQQKVLHVLNKSNAEQLSGYAVSPGRIKSIEKWKIRKGQFTSLADVLEVDGLGVKVLERLCERILGNEEKSPPVKTTIVKRSKVRRPFLTPELTNEQTFSLASVVGLYLSPTGLSWARLCRDGNHLSSWDIHDFSAYPKKMLPHNTYQLAQTVLDMIPTAEVYIFEAAPNLGLAAQGTKQATIVTSYNQQLELTSMLLALINTSQKHNETSLDNIVYYLSPNLPARLFSTLMGSERVSWTKTVSTLLDNIFETKEFGLPCTPVSIEEELREKYYLQCPVNREVLGQALLLVITFMDLCVYKNPVSVNRVAPGKRKVDVN